MTSAIHSDVHEKFCELSKQVSELQTGQARRISDAKSFYRPYAYRNPLQEKRALSWLVSLVWCCLQQVNHRRLLAKLDLDRAPKAKEVGQSESLVQRLQILEESLPALRKQQNLEEEVRNLQEMLSSHQAKYHHFEEALTSHKSQIQDKVLSLDTKLDAISKSVMQAEDTERMHLEIEKYLRGCSLSCKLRGLESEMMSSKQNTSKTLADIAAKSQELEHEIAGLQQKMWETAALLPAYSEKLEKLEIGQKSLRRGIAELDCKIPSLHEDIPADDVTMEGFQSSPDKLEELESEGGSLPEMLERMEERMEDGRLSERSSAKSEGLSPVSPPACRVEASGEGYVAGDGRGERSAGEIKEFKYPKKPENDAMRKICLSVEEELLQAMKREEPLEVRKKLLKDVCRRLHSVGGQWVCLHWRSVTLVDSCPCVRSVGLAAPVIANLNMRWSHLLAPTGFTPTNLTRLAEVQKEWRFAAKLFDWCRLTDWKAGSSKC